MHRIRIDYGWTTFWLIALLVFTATWSVQQADWAEGLHILTPITILGLIVGLVLTQLRQIPPFLAHITAFVIGAFVVLFQMTSFLADTLGSRVDKLAWLWDRWAVWFSALRAGNAGEDLYLFILLMASMLWVLSYAAVWFLLRSGWIWLTLLLPGVVVLLNLGYSRQVSTFLLIVYLFTALLLLMRFNFIEREREWRERGVPYPDTLVLRGFWTAAYLAIVLILAAWIIPFSPQTDRATAAWDVVSSPFDRIENRFGDSLPGVFPGGSGGGGGVGGFASFDSEFALGGSLRLSEEPVVLLEGDGAPYLVAHRYDRFNGFGWESTADQTYRTLEGDRETPPLLRYDAHQEFPIPDAARQNTVERSHEIEVLRPQGSIVFSGGETLRASVPTRVQTAWYTYEDQEILIDNATEGNTPPDLWALVRLLNDADFGQGDEVLTPDDDSNTAADDEADVESGDNERNIDLGPIDPETLGADALELFEEIVEEQERLLERGIETEILYDDELRAEALTFSGPLPVFSDVESIYASEMRSGDAYQVTSLISNATNDNLRNASEAYPVEITRRYLQVPDDHSTRVEELALEITAPHDNPYDKAEAIETWLRTNLEYSEQIIVPPEGVDFIEHFIFESQQGYCTYYSSAMAQMLRMVEIPARVAVGYFPADYDEEAGGYLYRDRNAHAWVEVYFPDYGWILFEPTPSRSTIQRGTAGVDDPAGSEIGVNDGLDALGPDEQWFLEDEEMFPVNGSAGDFTLDQQQSTTTGQWIMRGVAVLLFIGVGIFSYFWLRGLGGLTPAGQFYTRLNRAATWTGIQQQESMTPYEYARTIATSIPGSRTDAEYLADLYVRERYGNQRVASPDLTRARAAWLRLRGLFIKYALLYRWRRTGRDS
jgi:transglutaminase-like putative cysteine protease